MDNKERRAIIFSDCQEMGEAAVLRRLKRGPLEHEDDKLPGTLQQRIAWDWVYAQRLKREAEQSRALRMTAFWTLMVAVGTFIVALVTAVMAFRAAP